MTTFINTAFLWDNHQEYDFRQWKNYISARLTSAGFVKTSDTGQLATDMEGPIGYGLYNGTGLALQSAGTTLVPNAFDQNTGTSWATTLIPAAGVLPNTFYLVWDCGTGNSATAATYKIYMAGANGDPAGWKLQGSNDNSSWTDLDTQSGISVTSGYQTYTVGSPAAYRWYRLAITNVRGTTTALTFTDWQLMTSAPANIISWSPLFTAAANTFYGYEIWRFADSLQSTVPIYLKIEYGNGSNSVLSPAIALTMGSGSDGAGNITGANVTTRITTTGSSVTTPNTFAPTGKCVGSYDSDGSRIVIALGYNCAVPIIFALERLRDYTGTVTGNGAVALVTTNSASSFVVCAYPAGSPAVETVPEILMSNAGTGAAGGNVAFYEVVPFLGPRQGMMLQVLAYFNANTTAEASVTVPVYGSNHTYYPLGSNSSTSIRSNTAAWALLYE